MLGYSACRGNSSFLGVELEAADITCIVTVQFGGGGGSRFHCIVAKEQQQEKRWEYGPRTSVFSNGDSLNVMIA